MIKPKSYSTTPIQAQKQRSILKASQRVLSEWQDLVTTTANRDARNAKFKRGVEIMVDALESYENIHDVNLKLSAENEALKMIYQSTEQERKDQKQNQEFIKRLIEENDKLKQ